MRKKKLKIIQAYIYAKTMFLISSNTETQKRCKVISDFVCCANVLSQKLLFKCEEKIKKQKIYDASFLLLKQNLEKSSYKNDFLTNYIMLCKMFKEYNYYENIVV